MHVLLEGDEAGALEPVTAFGGCLHGRRCEPCKATFHAACMRTLSKERRIGRRCPCCQGRLCCSSAEQRAAARERQEARERERRALQALRREERGARAAPRAVALRRVL